MDRSSQFVITGIILSFFSVVFWSSVVWGIEKSAPPFSAKLDTSFGRNLSYEDPQTAFTFEPELSYDWSEKTRLALYSLLNRPTDPYLNFNVPKTILSLHQWFDSLSSVGGKLIFSLNAVNLDRWSADGSMLRTSVGFQATQNFFEKFTLLFRITPYLQFNQYSQSSAQSSEGANLTRAGITERVGLSFEWEVVTLETLFILDQRYTSVWYNDFASSQTLIFRLTKQIAVGVDHTLLGSFIDDSTGLYGGFKVFDNRESRVSTVVRVNL